MMEKKNATEISNSLEQLGVHPNGCAQSGERKFNNNNTDDERKRVKEGGRMREKTRKDEKPIEEQSHFSWVFANKAIATV